MLNKYFIVLVRLLSYGIYINKLKLFIYDI